MTVTQPFGPTASRSTPRPRSTGSAPRCAATSPAPADARRRRRAVRWHRLQRGRRAVRRRAGQGAGLRPAHAGAGLVRRTRSPSAARLRLVGIDSTLEDITPVLEARLLPAPRRRDPDGVPRVRPRLQVQDRAAERHRVREPPPLLRGRPGARRHPDPARLTTEAYLGIVAATNFKQRVRKMMEYYHADRLNYVVDRHAQPARVRPGLLREARRRGGRRQADRPPLQDPGLRAGGVPRRARGDPDPASTTDTYSLPQSQEEFYFSLPYDQMDLCLYGKNTRTPVEEVAAAGGLTPSRSSACTATSTRSGRRPTTCTWRRSWSSPCRRSRSSPTDASPTDASPCGD